MENTRPAREYNALFAALLLIIMPLAALPLSFLRITGTKIPHFSDVEFFHLPELGVLALAVLCFFHRRLTALWKASFIIKIFSAASALLLITTLLQANLFVWNWQNCGTALFYAATPLAAAVLAPELDKLLPRCAAGIAILLLISGTCTEHVSGFAGNWNWNQGLIAALLPAAVMLVAGRKKYWSEVALIMLAIFFAVIFFAARAQFSRGALCASAAAVAVLWIWSVIPEKWRFPAACGLFFVALLIFITAVSFCDIADSRFQLWRAGVNLTDAEYFCGIGAGRFNEIVPQYLEKTYFFSPFATPNHPHPHNEVLLLWSSFGIAGILFCAAIFAAVLTSVPRRPDKERFSLMPWIFLVIFFAGAVDLTANIPMGAALMLISAGVCAAKTAPSPLTETAPLPAKPLPAFTFTAIALLGLALYSACGSFAATTELRLARIAADNNDLDACRKHLQSSIAVEPRRESLYLLANLEAFSRNNTLAAKHLLALEKLGSFNYLHIHRIQATVLAADRQFDAALEQLKADSRNYPFSIKNALLTFLVSRDARKDKNEIRQAYNHYLELCRLRNHDPRKPIADRADDSSLPPEKYKRGNARKHFPVKSALQVVLAALLGVGLFFLFNRRR